MGLILYICRRINVEILHMILNALFASFNICRFFYEKMKKIQIFNFILHICSLANSCGWSFQ
jgi:hypothetical protein